jgi:hypothetical protein
MFGIPLLRQVGKKRGGRDAARGDHPDEEADNAAPQDRPAPGDPVTGRWVAGPSTLADQPGALAIQARTRFVPHGINVQGVRAWEFEYDVYAYIIMLYINDPYRGFVRELFGYVVYCVRVRRSKHLLCSVSGVKSSPSYTRGGDVAQYVKARIA